jgi:hypothetical protein
VELRGLDAGQIDHVPREVVDGRHHAVVDAPLRLGLRDHVDHVDADRELRRHHGRVGVVSRVGPQLRHASVEVADLHLSALPDTEDAQHRGQPHDDDRRHPRRHAGEATPKRIQLAPAAVQALGVAGIERHVRQRDRQQHQVREDDGRHTDARRNRDFLDDPDLDEQNRDEPDHVRGQRGPSRQEQPPEAVARRRHAVGAGGHERADHLHAVAHRDGEHQERDQDRHRVDPESEQVDHAELPDHRQGRAAQDQERQPVRLGVQEHEPAGQEEAAEEEQHDPLGTGGHVAHHLGEPDDVHVHARPGHDVRVELVPHARLDLLRHDQEIEALARRRIELHQLCGDDRPGEIVGDQPPDDAGLEDVAPDGLQALWRRGEVVGNDVARGDAVFHHLGVPHVRREQRLHPRPIDAREEEDLIGRALQGVEEPGREHVAVAGHDRDQQPVRSAELLLVFDEGGHVRVLERQLLGEAGVDAQARRRPHEAHRREDEQADDETAMAEQQSLETRGERGLRHGAARFSGESRYA